MMRVLKLSLQSSVLTALLSLAGCQIFGIAARALPNNVDAAYAGLKGKDVAVMVWADRRISIDWPNMATDVTAGTQKKLQAAQASDKPKDLDGTTFPITPQSIARFQLEHPEAELMSIDEVAPIVKVKRLIYVEITNFQTRSDLGVNTDLFRGQISANVRVIEYENGKAKVVYNENNVAAKFPANAPNDGVSGLTDARTYLGTMDAFTTTLAERFYKHEEEQE